MLPELGDVRGELAKRDPAFFAELLGIKPDPWQAAVLRSTAEQELLNCSRQSGKSTVASVKAIHGAIYRPRSLVLVVSPSQRQSGELFRKVLGLVEQIAPRPRLREENKLSLELENGSRIVSLPSNAATVRGFSGVTLLIEDEAAFVRDEFHTAIRPMLATTRGQLLLMSTPFGKRGHFFDAWEKGGPGWARTEIPASQCPRISAAFLASERAALGEWRYRQEYECQFVESADQFFSYADVDGAFRKEVLPLFEQPDNDPPSGVEPLFEVG